MSSEDPSASSRWERVREWGAIFLSVAALIVSGLAFYQQGQANDLTAFNSLKDDLQAAFAVIFEGVEEGDIPGEVWIEDQWTEYAAIGDEASDEGVAGLKQIMKTIRIECDPIDNPACPSMLDPRIFDQISPLDVFVPDTNGAGGN